MSKFSVEEERQRCSSGLLSVHRQYQQNLVKKKRKQNRTIAKQQDLKRIKGYGTV